MKIHILDVIVLIIYFAAMASLGPLFARRAKTTEGYFLGDRSFPGWLTGISMFATSISSITFLAYPGDGYKACWFRMLFNVTLPIGTLVAVRLYLPFFRRGQITSAYEYLENRFGPSVRVYAAACFVVLQIMRVSTILYLLSQLIETVTGFDSVASVFIGGIITSFYTITGGIRAVLWTDFIQAIVLWVGGFLCLMIIAIKLGGPFEGFGEIFRVAMADGKLALNKEYMEGQGLVPIPTWSLDVTQKTVLLVLFAGLGDWLTELCGNQNVVQRYVASKSAKDARQALWICCWFSVPTWALFMLLGTALYVFYKGDYGTPETLAMLNGTDGVKPEGILPYFVMTQVPKGLGGLVIAAVLSAAMSSLSASINGVSAVGVVDIYKRHLVKGRDDRHYVIVAKLMGVGMAISMIIGALALLSATSTTLQDTYRVITALTAGGLFGIYLLGFATKSGDSRSIGVGIVLTLLYSTWVVVSNMTDLLGPYSCKIHSYYTGLVGHMFMFTMGFVISKLFPAKPRDLTNLTIYTQDGSPLD